MPRYCVFCVNEILVRYWKNILFCNAQNGNDAPYEGMLFALSTSVLALTDALRMRFLPRVASVYFLNLLSSFPNYIENKNYPPLRARQLEWRSKHVNNLDRQAAN